MLRAGRLRLTRPVLFRHLPAPFTRIAHGVPFTTTTSQPLYWTAFGPPSAPPILVLHGGPGAHHDYLLPGMLALADDHRLLFYDQRGGGRSRTDDRAPVTIDVLVEDLDRIIHELPSQPLVLLGYSFGGLLALRYAIEAFEGRNRVRPGKLILIDPAPVSRQFRAAFEAEFTRRQVSEPIAGMREELAASTLRERDPEAFRRRQFELSVAGYFADPERARDLTPFRVIGRIQQSVWESLGDYDLSQRLGVINCPTIILHGREDPIPLASSEAIAANIPGARLIVIDDAGHVPYVERPDALFPPIRAFLHEKDRSS